MASERDIKGGLANLSKWVCTDCGYIYDPSYGDTGSGIKAGVPFEELPADWIMPGMRGQAGEVQRA
jgi:rubredoxin